MPNPQRGARIAPGAAAHDGRVGIGVTDIVPGIAAADLPHLFDRFHQSRQSVASATGEGGLGLAIVKRIDERIVKLQDGAGSVVNRLGEDAQVRLSLPAAPA